MTKYDNNSVGLVVSCRF